MSSKKLLMALLRSDLKYLNAFILLVEQPSILWMATFQHFVSLEGTPFVSFSF